MIRQVEKMNLNLAKVTVMKLIFLIVASIAANASAQDFESLGSNEGVLKRAKSMTTQQEVKIVQKRAVPRDYRFEIGVGGGMVSGGNSYLSTNPFSANVDFHFTPKFSIGARYFHFANKLTAEGNSQITSFENARTAGSTSGMTVPDIDYPSSAVMGMISYYPVYGKINLFDLSVVQFDFYVTGGYGTIALRSGSSSTWTAGGGVGFWWNKYISSRFELRHQAYTDQVVTGSRDVGMLVGTFGLGILL